MNAIENLETIDVLQRARNFLARDGMRACSKVMKGFRLPGEWDPSYLFVAHKEAVALDREIRAKSSTNVQGLLLKKLVPLLAMYSTRPLQLPSRRRSRRLA